MTYDGWFLAPLFFSPKDTGAKEERIDMHASLQTPEIAEVALKLMNKCLQSLFIDIFWLWFCSLRWTPLKVSWQQRKTAFQNGMPKYLIFHILFEYFVFYIVQQKWWILAVQSRFYAEYFKKVEKNVNFLFFTIEISNAMQISQRDMLPSKWMLEWMYTSFPIAIKSFHFLLFFAFLVRPIFEMTMFQRNFAVVWFVWFLGGTIILSSKMCKISDLDL